MKIKWLSAAVANRNSQLAYIVEQDLQAAITMGDAIEAAIQDLVDYPQIGRLGRVPGSRELVVRGTPYVIGYRLDPSRVVILRVMHGARRWPNKL